jgi:hypothetical protein
MSKALSLQVSVRSTPSFDINNGKPNGSSSLFSFTFRILDTSIRKQVDTHRDSAKDSKALKSGKWDILDLALSDIEYGKYASTTEIIDQMKTMFFAGQVRLY